MRLLWTWCDSGLHAVIFQTRCHSGPDTVMNKCDDILDPMWFWSLYSEIHSKPDGILNLMRWYSRLDAILFRYSSGPHAITFCSRWDSGSHMVIFWSRWYSGPHPVILDPMWFWTRWSYGPHAMTFWSQCDSGPLTDIFWIQWDSGPHAVIF